MPPREPGRRLRRIGVGAWLLILSILRDWGTVSILLLISLPAVVSTVFEGGLETIRMQASLLARLDSRGGFYLVVSHEPTGNYSCIDACISNANITVGNRSLQTQIVYTGNVSRLVDLAGGGLYAGSSTSLVNCSIGGRLASILGVNVGSTINVSSGKQWFTCRVDGLHSSTGLLDYALIKAKGGWGQEGREYLCRVPRRIVLAETLGKGMSGVEVVLNSLILAGLLAYAPLIYIGLGRIKEARGKEIRLLRSEGLSRREIYWAFSAASLTAIAAAVLYGISLGLIMVHGSIWFLRYLGVLLPVRPYVPIDFILFSIGWYLFASILFLASEGARS